jgi:hypothetical protein
MKPIKNYLLVRSELFIIKYKKLFSRIEKTLLSSRMCDYPTITQGKTRIPGINDGEEFELTDVSHLFEKTLEIFTIF